jgi:hypothetical protein
LWRDQLRSYRLQLMRCEDEAAQIEQLLQNLTIPEEQRVLLRRLLTEIDIWLDPPMFNLPRP